MRKSRSLLALLAAACCTLGMAQPTFAVGTVTMANGGQYFSASGPAAYWHYDYGQGYCGNVAAWCAPNHSQWTYVNQTAGDVNGAVWRNPQPISYPEFASAFIPARNATATVNYTVRYAGGSYSSTTVNQLPYYNQWIRLNSTGLVSIDRVMLGDQSYWGTPSSKVAFDEIKIEN